MQANSGARRREHPENHQLSRLEAAKLAHEMFAAGDVEESADLVLEVAQLPAERPKGATVN